MKKTNYLKEELYELIKTDEGIFDFIQEFCLDGLWYWDVEHPEEEWMNPKFWSVLGYDHREMPHKASAWQDIIYPEDLKLAMDNFAKHCENPNYPYDQTVRYTHKNGSTVWIRCRGLAIRDKHGKPVRMLGAHQEITEYKHSELLLQKNTDLLRNSQQVSKTGSWELDIQTNEVVWTEELYEMYGFDPTLPPPPYTEHMKLFTPESWETLTSSLTLTREQGIPYELELKTLRKDDSNGWMWVRGEATYNENKEIIGLRGVAQDITERKKSELEKEALTKRLNYALDASGDGIWDWTPATGVTIFSKAWAEMLGYKMGELAFLAKEWSDRLHPDEIEWVFAEINKVTQTPKNGDTFSFEYRFRNKAGEYLWILNKAKVVERNEEGEATRVVGTHTNITDRRQIVEALKENERKLRNLTNNINESSLISITDENGIIIEINRLFCELSGYTEQELLGNTHSIINSGYHDKQFWENLWKTIKNGDIWRGEIKNRAKDGSEYWVYSVINSVKDSSGNIKQYISIRQNITDRKKTEFILQESEKKFRELFENLIDEVHLWKVIKDENGKITAWQLVDANPPALKTWGKPIHQIIGKTANEIFGSDAHAQFMPIVEKIFQTGKPHVWEEYFPATDQYLYMESIPSGDYFISTGKDITEQKKIQQALQESELRFAAAIEGTEAGIWDWDMVHNNVVFSKQWKLMLGYEDDEVANSFEGWQNLWHPDDKASIEKAVTDHLNGITQKYEVIHRCRHKDGRWRWIMTRGKILRDENGKPYRWIGTNVDISPQKQAEEDQKIAREQAEKASKAKSEFLANMSHEIRTPLNGVIGFTELLKNTPLNAVQQQYVHSANVSGHTLLGIINDILDFSKIEAGMLELEEIKTDMVELLEQSIDIVKFSTTDKNLELLLDIDPAMPRFASIDPIRTKQILANLLSNAVKFTHTGEVELKVVFQPLKGGQGKLSVFVRDTGIGISEEQKVKLFKSFSQADSSTTRKFGGTGLGLIISQMIAEKMGSKINIESTPDIGSTFFFDIITRFEDGQKPDISQITGVQRCLIIDDNANNRLILEQMLHQWQIATDTCRNGLEALQKLETSQPYDVIICDYNMPYLNGIETIRIMKEKLKLSTEKQPIVLLHTSSDNISLHQKCEELGIRFRLNKPVKSHDLFNYLVHCSQTSETTLPNKAKKELEPTLQSENIQILIVEDNPFNMLLSKTVLSQIVPNSIIYEAHNGLEAIEQYKNVAPDIIFMDVHMPVCDGIKATKQIREMEISTGKHTLIIALTAGALKEEKDKCLAAGMDNFFTKPIESQKIQTVLDNYWHESKKTTISLQEAPPTNEEIHCNYNELLASLDGNTKVVQQLITALMADIPLLINQLQEAYLSMDNENMRLIAHSIKGSMLGMRCNIVADIARTIEQDANNNFFDNIQLLLIRLEAEWQIVKNILLQKMES